MNHSGANGLVHGFTGFFLNAYSGKYIILYASVKMMACYGFGERFFFFFSGEKRWFRQTENQKVAESKAEMYFS